MSDEEAARLMAERFFQLFRPSVLNNPSAEVFIAKMFVAHEFNEQPGATRDALAGVFAQLMRDAREQKEAWTRVYIAAEAQRARDALGSPPEPGRFRVILPLESFDASLLVGGVAPPEDAEPAGEEEESPGVQALQIGASIKAALRQASARLFGLRDAMQARAGRYSRESVNAPDIPRSLNQGFAAELNSFAVSLEGVIYEAGLAPRPGSEGEAEALPPRPLAELAAEVVTAIFEECRLMLKRAATVRGWQDDAKTAELRKAYEWEAHCLENYALRIEDAISRAGFFVGTEKAEVGARLVGLSESIRRGAFEPSDEGAAGSDPLTAAFSIIADELARVVVDAGLLTRAELEGAKQ